MKRMLSILLILLLPPAVNAQEEESKDKRQKTIDLMLSKVKDELKGIYENRFELKARAYAEHFDLNDEQLELLRSVVEEMAKEMVDGHADPQLSQTIVRKVKNIESLKFFSVNGKNFSVDESQVPPEAPVKSTLTVSPAGDHTWLQGATGGSSMSSRTRIDVISDKRWRTALGKVSDKQLIEFNNLQKQRNQVRFLNLLEVVLADELMLSQDQRKPFRDWLDSLSDQLPRRSSGSFYGSVKRAMVNVDAEDLPDFLTEAQVQAYVEFRTRMGN
jgi:hypothetical protein